MTVINQTIEVLPVDKLIPYARNSRTHSDAQVAQIAASIREFGFTNPVLIDADGGIIAGHGRVLGARKLGMAAVPCIRLGYLTETQKRAYVIADNKIALNAGWDEDMLATELQELADMDFDLDLTGFDSSELDAFLAMDDETPEGETDADEVPEVLDEAVSKPGDVWLLGKHRLMCGDSTKADDVARLMNGEMADLCFTSPPYGNQRNYSTSGISDWDSLMQRVFANLPMTDDGQILVNLGMIHENGVLVQYWFEWMKSQGLRRFGWYVWDQGNGLPGNFGGRCAPSHEFIFHFNKKASEINKHIPTASPGNVSKKGRITADGWKRDAGFRITGTHKIPDSVWRIKRKTNPGAIQHEHPAIFPVELPVMAINSWKNELLYEPFSGSGTTIIAAEQTGRICYAMELSPNYVDVAVRRWQQYTGKQAILESTGQPFHGRT